MPSSRVHDAAASLRRLPASRLRWWRDHFQFVRAFLRSPRSIGAILPSGEALACAITAELKPRTKVLELGSGTGVFTRRMVAMGLEPSDLVLVEQDATLASSLRSRFPSSTVLQLRAQDLSESDHLQHSDIAATICGLPLRNMSDEDHRRVLAAAFGAMEPGGSLYLFTYSMTCPISSSTLHGNHLTSTLMKVVLRNLPPAFIYRISPQ